MYELKLSPHLWYEKLKNKRKKIGFTQLESCEWVFKIKDGSFEVVIWVSVDDFTTLRAEMKGI